MEVDLLSAESQIAIELDGVQHLANAEAYRRDRRKDVLLQAAPGERISCVAVFVRRCWQAPR